MILFTVLMVSSLQSRVIDSLSGIGSGGVPSANEFQGHYQRYGGVLVNRSSFNCIVNLLPKGVVSKGHDNGSLLS